MLKQYINEGGIELYTQLQKARELGLEGPFEPGYLANWHTSRQEGLVKRVIEITEKTKFNHKDGSCYNCNCKIHDQALDDLKAKLLEELNH